MADTSKCFNCGHANPVSKQVCESCGTPMLPESLGLSNEMKTQAIPSLDELLRKDRDAHDAIVAEQVTEPGEEAPDDGIAPTEALNYEDMLKAHPEFAALDARDEAEAAAKRAREEAQVPVGGVVIPGPAKANEPTQLLDLSEVGDLDALVDGRSSGLTLENEQPASSGASTGTLPVEAASEPAGGDDWGAAAGGAQGDWGSSAPSPQPAPAPPPSASVAPPPQPAGVAPPPPSSGAAPPVSNSSSDGGGKKTLMIVGGVVAVLLLCCCPLSVGGYAAWSSGVFEAVTSSGDTEVVDESEAADDDDGAAAEGE